jgi:hypothetical protein
MMPLQSNPVRPGEVRPGKATRADRSLPSFRGRSHVSDGGGQRYHVRVSVDELEARRGAAYVDVVHKFSTSLP